MRKLLILISVLLALSTPVFAMDYTAPTVPDSGEALMPAETETFSQGLAEVLGKAVAYINPSLKEAATICLSLVAIALLQGILESFPAKIKPVIGLVCTLSIAGLLLWRTSTLITLSVETIQELSDYGKLLLPVLAAAMASGGGVTSATALYAGTAVFNMLLGAAVSGLLVPMVYAFIVLSVAAAATDSDRINHIRDLVKGLTAWSLKIIIYTFTGYITITGVISGTADATALKVTKLTMSGMIPVVGGMLSDASEAVLVSAGLMKNAAGTYGVLALLAVGLMPFVQIGTQYLLLKLTGALCAAFGTKKTSQLIEQFTAAMGLLLAMTATMCLLLLISTVCFMRGVN